MFFYMEPLLYLSYMNLDYPLTELDRQTLNRIINWSIDWCEENLHSPIMGVIPSCRLDICEDCIAHYDVEGHEIVLNVNKIDTIRELLKNICHEWYHSTQDHHEYWDLHQKVGYDNHPHEKSARRYEGFYLLLYPHLLERLGTSPTAKDRRELWWGNLRMSVFGL